MKLPNKWTRKNGRLTRVMNKNRSIFHDINKLIDDTDIVDDSIVDNNIVDDTMNKLDVLEKKHKGTWFCDMCGHPDNSFVLRYECKLCHRFEQRPAPWLESGQITLEHCINVCTECWSKVTDDLPCEHNKKDYLLC